MRASTTTHGRFVDALENRTLLAATINLVNGVVEIRGDGGNDVISASWNRAADTVTFAVNGRSTTYRQGLVRSIFVDTAGGNDSVRFGGSIWRPGTILLGDGNDFAWGTGRENTIRGGNGNDTINGSAGNDQIFGEAGNDELEGAEDNDTVWGGDGDDALGGFTGQNLLMGEAGNDWLYGIPQGGGVLDGGAGFDRVQYAPRTWSLRNIENVHMVFR